MKTKTSIIIGILIIVISCKQKQDNHKKYPQQIGDTEFIQGIDNPNFTFCNPVNILHSGSRIYFKGGYKNFENQLIKAYQFEKDFEKFTGYFVIRFAVNCKNEIDRFRCEISDENFEKTAYPQKLEEHIISIFKNIKGWQHPVIDNQDYDGYTFVSIKFINGKIIKS